MYLGTPQGGEGLSQERPNISLEVPRLQPLSSSTAPDLFPSLIPWGTPPRPRVAQPPATPEGFLPALGAALGAKPRFGPRASEESSGLSPSLPWACLQPLHRKSLFNFTAMLIEQLGVSGQHPRAERIFPWEWGVSLVLPQAGPSPSCREGSGWAGAAQTCKVPNLIPGERSWRSTGDFLYKNQRFGSAKAAAQPLGTQS